MDITPYLQKLGYDKLKPKQIELINCFIRKEDAIGILPTGYGKSVCYILPHLLKQKNVVVISPLISLMEDQRLKLNEKGINTISFNSTNVFDAFDPKSDLVKLKKKELTGILYFSPESFIKRKPLITELLTKKLICLFAIDECHCITSWSDFREDYNNLGTIKDMINEFYQIPIMALTATATKDTIIKIKDKLQLDHNNIIKSSFVKNNLHLDFIRKDELQNNIHHMIKIIKKHNCKTIIYCKTKKETETISNSMNISGIPTKYYHGDLDTDKRTNVQNLFTTGKIKVITATIAFGMGIDISDIYLIIHYGISKEIESYYQEIGRAGRDGKQSFCYLFWSENDFRLNKYFVSLIKDKELKQTQSKKIRQIEDLIYSSECRMKFIVNYFGENYTHCHNCDNCNKIKQSQILPSNIYIYTILKTYIQLDHGIGINKLINILFGSNAKDITSNMKKVTTYNIYNRNTDKKYIQSIIQQLVTCKFLSREETSNLFGSFYNISELGMKFYRKNNKIITNSINIINKFGKKCAVKCTKKITKKNNKITIKSKPSSTGKRWTTHMDNELAMLIQQMDLQQIAERLQRSQRSIEMRIISCINNEKINLESLSRCSFIPSIEKIKKILDVYTSLSDKSALKNIKKELPKNYSYFDINIAISKYGNYII